MGRNAPIASSCTVFGVKTNSTVRRQMPCCAVGPAVRNLPLSMHLRRNQWQAKARRDSSAMFSPCAALLDAADRYRYERPIVMGSGTGSEPSVSIIHCANNLRISDTTDALAGSHATL